MKKQEHKADYYEDRINLYDYVQVIWRWKFIIVGIIIVTVLATLLFSYTITPEYGVGASFSPSFIEVIEKDTKKVNLEPVDSIENLVAYINGGIYNPMIFDSLNLDPFGLQFVATRPGEAFKINVYYETTNPSQGEVLVKELLNQIEMSYRWKITAKKNEILNIFKMILDDIVYHINNINLLRDAEKNMTRQIATIESNTEIIRNQRDRLLSEGSEADPVALLLYSNTIQQNIKYKDVISKSLEDNRKAQETEQNLLDIEESEFISEFSRMEKYLVKKDIASKFTELFLRYERALEVRSAINHLLENFKEAKILIEDVTDDKLIRVIEEPSSGSPIKPRRKRMIMINGFLSLILGLFLAFIIDFLKRSRSSSKES